MRRMSRRYELPATSPPPPLVSAEIDDDPRMARYVQLLVWGWLAVALWGFVVGVMLAAGCGSACNAASGSLMRAMGL